MVAKGDEFLGFVIVKTSISVQLNVDEHVGVGELYHEFGVLSDHDAAGAREQGIIVEVQVVRQQFVQNQLA